jgi:hypothetical protein
VNASLHSDTITKLWQPPWNRLIPASRFDGVREIGGPA